MERDSSVIEVVESVDDLSKLEEPWRAIAERTGSAFVTPEWILAWWRHLSGDRRPLTVTLWGQDGSLQGLLPFALHRSRLRRDCIFVGGGFSDHLQPVAAPANSLPLARAAARVLNASDRPWRLLALDSVDADRGWPDALAEGLDDVRVHTRSTSTLPYLDLSGHGGWQEFLSTRSASFRKRLRWLDRRLSDHRARVRLTTDPGELDRDLATLFSLHDRRWAGRGRSAIDAAARRFHSAFAAKALERGWLRLWTLEVRGKPIASWYGWRIGDRYSFYNGGFDPEWSRLSPGLFLLSRVIRAAFDEAASEFDLLLGNEAYKRRFADRSRMTRSLVVVPAASPMRLLIRGEDYGGSGAAARACFLGPYLGSTSRVRSGLSRDRAAAGAVTAAPLIASSSSI